MIPGGYVFRVAYAADLLLNAILGGNPAQTVSSRCYEGAKIKAYRRWAVPYWVVNGGAYALRWTIGRALGYRFGVDMPINHCQDSYDNASIKTDDFRTYS